jgi:hypothetical protein
MSMDVINRLGTDPLPSSLMQYTQSRVDPTYYSNGVILQGTHPPQSLCACVCMCVCVRNCRETPKSLLCVNEYS